MVGETEGLTSHIKIGTRSSILAKAQADAVGALLVLAGHSVELVPMSTKGDEVLDRSLHQIGQKGLFTEELERALRSNAIDIAVHSLKDLPTESAQDLEIAAYALPEDRRDVLISHGQGMASLPPGATVGTSSLRRGAFIKAIRPDLNVVSIRGNLKTRTDKWRRGEVDALVLAAAGVVRMGWTELITEYLDPMVVVPSPGQGILAVQAARHRADLAGVLLGLNDEAAEIPALAERACLAELGGGCQVPMGAYAEWTGPGRLMLVAQAGSADGRTIVRHQSDFSATEAQKAGLGAGQDLKRQGALKLMAVQER